MRKASPVSAILRTAYIWLVIGVLTIVISSINLLVALPLWLVDRKRRMPHTLNTLWGRLIFAGIPVWRLTVTGRHHLHPRGTYIFVANHQSLLDIMALFCIRRQFKWVAKDHLFMIPFLGWSMAMAGYIQLERGRHGSIRDTYAQAKEWLASGVSVFFFPEGTRSRTGEVGPFKNGAFKLALETGAPVVPIAVSGTRDIIERGRWIFNPTTRMRVTVLPPASPGDYHAAGADRFRDDVRDRIVKTVQES